MDYQIKQNVSNDVIDGVMDGYSLHPCVDCSLIIVHQVSSLVD